MTPVIDSATDSNLAAGSPKRARRSVALALLTASVLGLLAVGAIAGREPWPVVRALLYARGTGWLACFGLFASLCVTPVARVARRVWPRSRRLSWAPVLRRALGMSAAWLAVLHAIASIKGPLQGDVAAVLDTTHLLAGLSALAVLLVLLLTSFDGVIQLLRLRYFKPLHRLAFAAALLTLQHLALSPSCPRWLVLALGGVLVAGIALRLLLARASK